MSEPHTKGAHVLSAVKVLRANRERASMLLPDSLQKYLEQRILASSWYPLAEHLGLLKAIVQLWPAAGDTWQMMGRATAQADLGGIYKTHLKPGDPARSLESMAALWRLVHDTGEAIITLDGPTSATLTLVDFELRSRDFCRVTTGYIIEVLTLAGARDSKVTHSSCRGDGADECIWQATWRPPSS
jgi:uncharacterized protein (TIGR02265 family)